MIYVSSSYGNISHVGGAQHREFDSEGMNLVYILQPLRSAPT